MNHKNIFFSLWRNTLSEFLTSFQRSYAFRSINQVMEKQEIGNVLQMRYSCLLLQNRRASLWQKENEQLQIGNTRIRYFACYSLKKRIC